MDGKVTAFGQIRRHPVLSVLAVLTASAVAVLIVCACTMPHIAEVDRYYDGFELHYPVKEFSEPYTEPKYSVPRTLHLKGRLYLYLFKPDYFEGDILLDGFEPDTLYHENYVLEDESKYSDKFRIYFGSIPRIFGSTVQYSDRPGYVTVLKRTGTSEHILKIFANKAFDYVVFQISSPHTEDSRRIVFPSQTVEQANDKFWKAVWETGQKERNRVKDIHADIVNWLERIG